MGSISSYEFEVICKNELIKELKEKYNEDYTIQDLHLVWFSKTLQNLKCTICDLKDNHRYYECTYNGDKKELYVDIYEKVHNTVVLKEDFKKEVEIPLSKAFQTVDLDKLLKERYINKYEVKKCFETLRNYFERINATDEDIEYLKEKEKKLLQED